MENTIRYRNAKRQVDRKLGFFAHLTAYILINSVLIMFHLLRSPEAPLSFAPLFGWGIGLLFHGLAVFLRPSGATRKQRMIDQKLSEAVDKT